MVNETKGVSGNFILEQSYYRIAAKFVTYAIDRTGHHIWPRVAVES
ncbi:MAG: hypothetical protein VX220_01450 [Pseudomonadota bacterium]|nr:hypothetical protein [Pseudomonadota bacterium]MEE3237538.1 hypothetical protein [Pseudomonadota bacterium]